MLIEYPNGRRKEVRESVGRALMKIKGVKEVAEGSYLTRDMADQPKVSKQLEEDGLDLLDKTSLHALAKERGLELDGRLGADRVRSILRGESAE